MIDLHMHSIYSDGTDSVIELLEKAQSKKLTYISITDHNTCGAYEILDTLFASYPNVERRIEFDHKEKRLFQVSDMLTVIDKLDYKRKNNIPFTKAEKYFFNGKDFRHIINLLKKKRI